MYHRKYFIKDLFSTRGLLNLFDLIQFESVKDFSEAVQHHWFEAGRNQSIIVKLDDYSTKDFINILERTQLTQVDQVSVDISNVKGPLDDIYRLLQTTAIQKVYLDLDVINSVEELIQFYEKAPKSWSSEHPLILKVFVDKDNYKNQLNSVVEVFMKTPSRFFKIFLDYESLSDLTFKDFEDFKFRLEDLSNWGATQKTKSKLDYIFSSSCKSIVLQDSKIYINDYALKDQQSILNLTNKEGLSGENIDTKELATFRAYLDLKKYVGFEGTGMKKFLIDPYLNKKLTGSYIMLPTITKAVLAIFEGTL